MKKLLILLLMTVLALFGCQSQSEGNNSNENVSETSTQKELKKVSVVLDWTPNTNHTGLYVAKENGYFEEQGLDVEIIMPGDAGADQLIASGNADFGVSVQESITQARTQGVPIVSIAAIIQHNTSGFASPAELNITSPKDFEGKTYGGWGSPIEQAIIDTLMSVENADINKLEIINAGDADFFTMANQGIDFAWVFYGWTGIEAELRGEEINMVYLTDYSEKLDYYTPVLATNEKMISENPEIVKAFVTAASKGYQFAIDNPEEAASILSSAVPELDAELVVESQKWLSSKYQDDAPRWGEQKLEVWRNYANWMEDNGFLEGEFDPEKAFTNEFLPQ
ncbi:ABC transporter substrate-binding protein [Ureibacillus massiliensis 4400831 = CIP 108448 = CCUG 49529]|uniref:ABC transporter substrate-binding protein n=1 Tax=Ureibacillus massiliensis 4400831 = CIP 108448 = CCUG 49529 TaxID=1211035 RepID=A0A0A3JAY3_9BACL|nr:ABC transporter substrate-binding protein [Ureibacillus massiliensis]KGR92313.1 ABC transporter substrate-binding protein [Ureibacillus massiliensis 4400831 = CIP 108448 = CCUG 49529]